MTSDIPSEYLVGLGRGRLGEWLQEVVNSGGWVAFGPISDSGPTVVIFDEYKQLYPGAAPDNDVEHAMVRAYLAWRDRER